MKSKLDHLVQILSKLDNALLAYSGGVDSVFLAKVAYGVLGKRVIALTSVSPSFPSYELEATRALAKSIGIPHMVVETHELDREGYRKNQGDRCYHCKTELYEVCREKAKELGFATILNGTIVDDMVDYRPGLKAAEEGGVRSPLVEAGLSKAEIRVLSRELGLPTWDKQALACLGSRFPPGTEVTLERLQRIDRIESEMIRMGFRNFRVRFHEPIARIETHPDEFALFLEPGIRQRIADLCRDNGFLYTSLDLEGYRSGSLNPLPIQIKSCKMNA